MAGSPKVNDDKTAATGESEPDAARPVRFEPKESARPGKGKEALDQPPDAAELAGTKRKDGQTDRDVAPPGAVSPDKLTTESDDGVS